MSDTRVIRYQTTPESADENQRLIEGVFAALAETTPEGVSYTALRLDDGVSFVHVVQLEGEANPLPGMSAFQEFQADLGRRVAVGPTPSEATVVGSYGAFGG